MSCIPRSVKKKRKKLFGRRKAPSTASPSTTKVSQSRQTRDIVKRRFRVQLAIIDRPLQADAEFLIDARYRSAHLLGAGSFGIVVSAIDSLTKARVAIKKILSAFANARMARHVLREIRLLRHLHHPHIVKLLDIDVPTQYSAWDSVYLVTPLLATDLRSALKAGKVDDPLLQKRIAFQLLLALDHMHQAGLMHRDIKSRNLLLDDNFNVQLCDLGEARFYSKANRDTAIEEQPEFGSEPQLSGAITTVIQVAPELSLGAIYNAEVDIWAAGCVIAEVVHPKHDFVFNSTSLASHIQEIVDVVGYPSDDLIDILPAHGVRRLRRHRKASSNKNRVGEFLGPNPDAAVVDLLEKMLCFSPNERLSAKCALEHSWFDDVRDETQAAKEGYNFALSEPAPELSKAELKELVWQEVVAFHPEAKTLGVH